MKLIDHDIVGFSEHRFVVPGQVVNLEEIEVGKDYIAEALTTGSRVRMTALTGAYSSTRDRVVRADFRMADGVIEARSMIDASVLPSSKNIWNNVNRLINIPKR